MTTSDELRRLLAEATPGPWIGCAHVIDKTLTCGCGFYGDVWDSTGEYVLLQGGVHGELAPPTTTQQQALSNLRLVVAMRNALPDLLDERDRLLAENAQHCVDFQQIAAALGILDELSDLPRVLEEVARLRAVAALGDKPNG